MWETGEHVPLKKEVAMQLWKIVVTWDCRLRVLNILIFQENPEILSLIRNFSIS